jgi:hypothetical protein
MGLLAAQMLVMVRGLLTVPLVKVWLLGGTSLPE